MELVAGGQGEGCPRCLLLAPGPRCRFDLLAGVPGEGWGQESLSQVHITLLSDKLSLGAARDDVGVAFLHHP